MDVRDWLKIASIGAGIALVLIGVTVGATRGDLLVPIGVGLITSAGVRSTGVSGLVQKVRESVRPPPMSP